MSCRSGTAQQYRDMPDFSLLNIITFFRVGSVPQRVDYHCISDDPKHDTSLQPSSLNDVVTSILKERPRVCHFEITTDTSKKEFKSVSVFKRVANIAAKVQKTFMLSTFGSQHGKFLYDPAGFVWEKGYKKKFVAMLGVEADNLVKVAVCMNDIMGSPSTEVLLNYHSKKGVQFEVNRFSNKFVFLPVPMVYPSKKVCGSRPQRVHLSILCFIRVVR